MKSLLKNFCILFFCAFLIIVFFIANNFCITNQKINSVVYANTYPPTQDFACYKYEGIVPHFFTHQIINDAQKAFSKKLAHHYDKDCITHDEFEKFLIEMYNNNFCLVDIYDVVGVNNKGAFFKELYVPLGKKPFLLSFDDMSYDSCGLGLSDKIILDDKDEIASYTASNDNPVEYNKEAICIMESFIKKHPDFSCRNARAIICPTGYDGILGYRINKNGINREQEIKQIKPLITKLKKLNYHFGCHTYNHIQIAYASEQTLYDDLMKFQQEIIPVIGETPILCFPCGDYISKGYKLNILKSFGYKIFLCVGDAKTIQKNDCVFLKRDVLNGISLRNYHKQYFEIFDTEKVYDHKYRTIKFPKYN